MRNINSTVIVAVVLPHCRFLDAVKRECVFPSRRRTRILGGCSIYLTGTNIMQPCLVVPRVIVGRALASGKPAAPQRSQSREVHSRRRAELGWGGGGGMALMGTGETERGILCKVKEGRRGTCEEREEVLAWERALKQTRLWSIFVMYK